MVRLPCKPHFRPIRTGTVLPCITTMVAFNRPIPERKQRGNAGDGSANSGLGGMFNAWMQAEKLMQVAMMLPSAGFIGWLAGYGLDRWLHRTWIGMAGAIFGIVAGLIGAVRMAIVYGADSAEDSASGKPGEDGDRDDTGDTGKTS